jgi:hypothetical protein
MNFETDHQKEEVRGFNETAHLTAEKGAENEK